MCSTQPWDLVFNHACLLIVTQLDQFGKCCHICHLKALTSIGIREEVSLKAKSVSLKLLSVIDFLQD